MARDSEVKESKKHYLIPLYSGGWLKKIAPFTSDCWRCDNPARWTPKNFNGSFCTKHKNEEDKRRKCKYCDQEVT